MTAEVWILVCVAKPEKQATAEFSDPTTLTRSLDNIHLGMDLDEQGDMILTPNKSIPFMRVPRVAAGYLQVYREFPRHIQPNVRS
jgi:hypothetical protein